jgi:hypothetical protein
MVCTKSPPTQFDIKVFELLPFIILLGPYADTGVVGRGRGSNDWSSFSPLSGGGLDRRPNQ